MGAPRRAGCTPLVVAAMHGRADAIALLAAAGSDPDARGRKGAAAVHFAAGASPPRPAVAFGRAAYRGAAGGVGMGKVGMAAAAYRGAAAAADSGRVAVMYHGRHYLPSRPLCITVGLSLSVTDKLNQQRPLLCRLPPPRHCTHPSLAAAQAAGARR